MICSAQCGISEIGDMDLLAILDAPRSFVSHRETSESMRCPAFVESASDVTKQVLYHQLVLKTHEQIMTLRVVRMIVLSNVVIATISCPPAVLRIP